MTTGTLYTGTHTLTLADGISRYMGGGFGAFMHYGLITHQTDQNSVSPNEDPNQFNPLSLDTNQWVRVYRSAKMNYAMWVVRHCDGWCNWPSATNRAGPVSTVGHTLADSSWYAAHGNRDIVSEYVTNFRAAGILPCFYISPCDLFWEYNHPGFAQADYLAHIQTQLTELMAYRPAAFWWDGNNWGLTPGTRGFPVGFTPLSPSAAGSNWNHYPFASGADLKSFIHGLDPACVVVGDAHHNDMEDGDIVEWETPNLSTGVADPYGPYGASALSHIAGNTELSVPLAGGDWYWINGTAPGSAATVLASLATLKAGFASSGFKATMLLNCPPDNTGLVSSAFASVLATVGASL